MRYTVIRRLARGGMGVVDLARAEDGTEVALKRLALGGTAAEMQAARTRFTRELDVLRRLEHDAVVPMLDVVDDAGEIVLVMPYLRGGNLAERVASDGPLPADEVLAIAGRLLPALAAAHRIGIVHRDIKPANILFDEDGRAHLADFGVAQTQDLTVGLTSTGVILGTPGFLSPEQARGETLTPASDIASLGSTLHYAATGRSPYEGGDPHAVLLRTARGRAAVDRTLPPRLRQLVSAMLQPRADRRPSAAGLSRGAAGTDPIPRVGPGRRRTVTVLAVLGATALATVGGAVLVGRGGNGGHGATTTTPTTAAPPAATSPPCIPLAYQPCGEDPAPFTDGRACIDDHADYDAVSGNGCEAAPDDFDGTVLTDRITANIVPADDRDEYPVDVDDKGDLLCNNTFRVTLSAPPGMTLQLELLDPGGAVVGRAVAAGGVAGEISLRDPNCFRDDGGRYRVVVAATGSDRVADSYVLARSGSF